MARPDYEDSIVGEDDEPSTMQGDTTGWLQHGQNPNDVEKRSG